MNIASIVVTEFRPGLHNHVAVWFPCVGVISVRVSERPNRYVTQTCGERIVSKCHGSAVCNRCGATYGLGDVGSKINPDPVNGYPRSFTATL